MREKNIVKPLYMILLLYEDVNNENSNIQIEDYLGYLDRISIEYLGMGKNNIYYSLQGLKSLGKEVSHKTVKSVVFHMINEIKKGDNNGI